MGTEAGRGGSGTGRGHTATQGPGRGCEGQEPLGGVQPGRLGSQLRSSEATATGHWVGHSRPGAPSPHRSTGAGWQALGRSRSLARVPAPVSTRPPCLPPWASRVLLGPLPSLRVSAVGPQGCWDKGPHTRLLQMTFIRSAPAAGSPGVRCRGAGGTTRPSRSCGGQVLGVLGLRTLHSRVAPTVTWLLPACLCPRVLLFERTPVLWGQAPACPGGVSPEAAWWGALGLGCRRPCLCPRRPQVPAVGTQRPHRSCGNLWGPRKRTASPGDPAPWGSSPRQLRHRGQGPPSPRLRNRRHR